MKNNLKSIRCAFGISIAELSRMTGINRVTLSQYENGKKNLKKARVDTLMKLADAFGIDNFRLFFLKLPPDFDFPQYFN